jgi:hypothetical protein
LSGSDKGRKTIHDPERAKKVESGFPLPASMLWTFAAWIFAGEGARTTISVLVWQYAFGFFRIHRPVVQLAALEENLDERRAHVDRALDQRL